MDLRFTFELRNNPYKNESGSEYEIWSRISLSFNDELLFEQEWNLLPVVEWYYRVRYNLEKEIPINNPDDLSIAELRSLLFDNIENYSIDDYLHKLEDYFSNHTFTLSGTFLPTFYIGLNNKRIGEVSYFENGNYIVHNFMMTDFLKHLECEINTVLLEWKNSGFYTDEAYGLVYDIQEKHNVKIV
ncbi:hypothetical protein [Flavobacterium sp. C4GT6]|uniref:hypothetical protein n=1 Tax=Flavobacterium sp. C4GT6 TaxID=3103818 RepID=UPI002ED36800